MTQTIDTPAHTHERSRAEAALFHTSRLLALFFTLALLISINFEVFSRFFLDSPTVWVTEYAAYFVVAITFLGAAFTHMKNSHIQVSLLIDLLPSHMRIHLDLMTVWITLPAVMILAWQSAGFIYSEFIHGTRDFGLLATQMWIPQSVIAIGYFGLTAALILQIKNLSRTDCHIRSWTGGALIAIATLLLYLDALELVNVIDNPSQGIWLVVVTVLLTSSLWSGVYSTFRLCAYAAPPLIAYYFTRDISLGWQSAILLLALLYFLLSGVRVFFTLILLGLLGVIFWLPSPMVSVLAERSWRGIHSFELSAIPMFVLMGALLVRSDASSDMFTSMRILFGRIRGGLAFASIGAAGIFAAVSGSSLATAATMGRIAGPEMVEQGYSHRLTYGVLAAGGTLGILIPPSIALIIYGSLAGVPVTHLFIASVIPGLILMGLFALVVISWIALRPQAAPPAKAYTLREKARSMLGMVPILGLMFTVLGTLYMGIATPTEAGGVGAISALLLCLLRRTLSWNMLFEAMEETVVVTSFLLCIAAGAAQMSYVMDYLSMSAGLVDFVRELGLSGGLLLAGVVIIYLLLGMFIEPISMVVMTLPVVLPLIHAAGWDPLWFGVVLVVLIEIGLITPPVGMILFVLEGVSDGRAKLHDISVGALPFVAMMLFSVALFYWFPELVTWLPSVLVGSSH